jgi:hypothetical protein
MSVGSTRAVLMAAFALAGLAGKGHAQECPSQLEVGVPLVVVDNKNQQNELKLTETRKSIMRNVKTQDTQVVTDLISGLFPERVQHVTGQTMMVVVNVLDAHARATWDAFFPLKVGHEMAMPVIRRTLIGAPPMHEQKVTFAMTVLSNQTVQIGRCEYDAVLVEIRESAGGREILKSQMTYIPGLMAIVKASTDVLGTRSHYEVKAFAASPAAAPRKN